MLGIFSLLGEHIVDQFVYIFGQFLGLVAIALGFITYQMKTQKQILLLQIITTAVFGLHYLMIGALTGMAMNLLGIARTLTYYFRYGKKGGERIIPIFYAVVLGAVGILTWEAWYSIFVFLGLVIHTLCLAFRDPQKMRMSILVTSPLVLIYDVFTLSIGGIVYESVAIVSCIIGIVKYKKNYKKEAIDNV